MSKTTAIDLVAGVQWAITQEGLQNVLTVANRQGDVAALAANLGRPLDNTRATIQRGSVAVINISGPMFPKANLLSQVSGATSTEGFFRDFNTAMSDDSIQSIILNIDSPGGAITGINELSQSIFSARGKKRIVTYANGTMASAAYWVGSAADEIVIDQTALIGSIGVMMSVSVKKELDITTHEIISSQSPQKNQSVTTEEGRSSAQKLVDDLAAVFVDQVALHRGVDKEKVLSDFGRGGMFVGEQAIANGMADRIGSLESIIQELNSKSKEKSMSETQVPAAAVQSEQDIQNRINAAVALAVEKTKVAARAEEVSRIAAIQKLSQPGFESVVKEAIESGASASDTALKIMTAMSDRGITLNAIKADSPKAVAGQAPSEPKAQSINDFHPKKEAK